MCEVLEYLYSVNKQILQFYWEPGNLICCVRLRFIIVRRSAFFGAVCWNHKSSVSLQCVYKTTGLQQLQTTRVVLFNIKPENYFKVSFACIWALLPKMGLFCFFVTNVHSLVVSDVFGPSDLGTSVLTDGFSLFSVSGSNNKNDVGLDRPPSPSTRCPTALPLF